MITTISFIRHGEVHNPNKTYYGRRPRYRISATGQKQAEITAEYLRDAPITAIYSSPMLRARQTAKAIMGVHPHSLRISQLLNEVHTPYDGQPQTELYAIDWDVYTGTPPEFEQPADITARMVRFIKRTRQRHSGQHVVAVTHADPFAFAVLWASGRLPSVPGRRNLTKAGLPDDFPGYAAMVTMTFNSHNERPTDLTYFNPS